MSYAAVMAGGALGAGARLALSGGIANYFGASFPWGTLAVNTLGCFLIGVFGGFTGPDGLILVSPLVRQAVMIGVLGGFTTYSSFSLQTLELLADGQWFYAAGNIFLTLGLCLGGTWAGLALAAAIQNR